MYYFGYRCCNPLAGRWLNRDPLQKAGGFNLYAYVSNAPGTYMDPFGLCPTKAPDNLPKFGGGGGGGGAGDRTFSPNNVGPNLAGIQNQVMAPFRAVERDLDRLGDLLGLLGDKILPGSRPGVENTVKAAVVLLNPGKKVTQAKRISVQVEQYALKATEPGFHPVIKRGFAEPQGGVFLNAGETWKFGTTQNPST